MTNRLPKSKNVTSTSSYIKIGLQVYPDTYKKMKMASAKEGRNNRDLLNQAIKEYIQKHHPDIDNLKP